MFGEWFQRIALGEVKRSFSLCGVDCVLSQYNETVFLSFIIFYAPIQCLYCVRGDVYSVLDFFVRVLLAAKQALNTESGFRLSYRSQLIANIQRAVSIFVMSHVCRHVELT